MRNIEVLRDYFLGKDPQLKETLADNSLRLIGVKGEFFVQRKELSDALKALKKKLEDEMDDKIKELLEELDIKDIQELIREINALAEELDADERDLANHKADNTRHLTETQITIIANAINATEAGQIASAQIVASAPGIVSEAVSTANGYTDTKTGQLRTDLEKQIGELNVPQVIDPSTGELVDQPISEALEVNPQRIVNPEYFYRFKNMVDNSSFEVFNGNTMVPLGWDNGVASEDASMFHSHSLKLTAGQISKQTSNHQADVTWMQGAYDTDDVIVCFYHKFDSVGIKVYDVVNDSYLPLTYIGSDLEEGETANEIVYPYASNWNQYRCMVKFTPRSSTRKVRIEFNCKTGGTKGECYIDAPSMEPYVASEYPSIYKDGRYSESAYQLLNPPPTDVDRFTPLEHLDVTSSLEDANGNIYYQELSRTDGTLAIKRQASNPDTNGYYQTIIETFYKKNGVTVNYVDTYTITYSSAGAVMTQSKTTTEVV